MNNRTRFVLAMLALPCAALPGQSMQLSMEEAIAAALDRNFSIQIERIEPKVADQQVRAASGIFDPFLQSEYEYRNNELRGFGREQETASFSVGVGSVLPWGTQWTASLESSDNTIPFTNDPVTGDLLSEEISSYVNSFAGITVTQPVLRGFGLDGSYSEVRIARESATASWEGFRAQVMDIVEATITAYQNLYFAQESLRIAERNRDLALQLLKDNEKRVETGAMAPLDIVQAESEAALREVSVISAGALLRQTQNALKSLIWNDPESVLALELSIQPPGEPVYFEPNLVRDYALALDNRPEYLASLSGLNIREFQVRQLKRNALPQLDIVGSVGRRGLDLTLNDSIDQSFGDGESSYSIGAVFSVPFPNRTRSAEKTQAYLRRNQAELGIQQLEQDIRLELDNAATRLTADWERIRAARTARELAEKSLAAEEKKLQVGTSTTFVVLRLQGDLANAEIREINALADYRVSLARYNRARGRILDTYNIILEN
ncbi:MAG: TolC family protein [Puniceicoccaceae bacterium]